LETLLDDEFEKKDISTIEMILGWISRSMSMEVHLKSVDMFLEWNMIKL